MQNPQTKAVTNTTPTTGPAHLYNHTHFGLTKQKLLATGLKLSKRLKLTTM